MTFAAVILCGLMLSLVSCQKEEPAPEPKSEGEKIGILLVNHGSHSKKWREMLMDVEEDVKDDLLGHPRISEVKTAFMEYTEPSIATCLKEFDQAEYDHVIIVPLLLTISAHYLDDIPIIAGMKSDPRAEDRLVKEKIEIYHANVAVTITPPLDYTVLIKQNVERRVLAQLSGEGNEGVVLVAYGDQRYLQQWEELIADIGQYLKTKMAIETVAYAWCGHLVGFSKEPTKNACEQVLELEEKAIVIPLLVAVDPFLQDDAIGAGIKEVQNPERVIYARDSILPDKVLNDWIIDIAIKSVEKL
jgi:hypothetical protein